MVKQRHAGIRWQDMVSSAASSSIFHSAMVLMQGFIRRIKYKWRTTWSLLYPLSASLPSSGVCTVVERSVRAAIYALWDLHNHLLAHRQEKGRRAESQRDPQAENSCWQLTRDPPKAQSCLQHLPQSSCGSCFVGTHSRIPPPSSCSNHGYRLHLPLLPPETLWVLQLHNPLEKSRTLGLTSHRLKWNSAINETPGGDPRK